MDSKKIKERLLGVAVTVVTALVCFYFGSFATKSQVDLIASELKSTKSNLETNYPKSVELQKVIGKIDKIQSALCIMDRRTCNI